MQITRRTLWSAAAATAIVGTSRQSRASALPDPTAQPILVISGRISVHNEGDTAVFDRSMLEALGVATIHTRTPWYDTVVSFQGVPMKLLMDRIGASGQELMVTALNDYTTQIPLADFDEYNVILALKRDGKYMEISDKGPLFIVYPFDSDRSLQQQVYYSRSAWQVAQMQVV